MKPIGLLIMSLALSACNAPGDATQLAATVPFERLESREVRERGQMLYLKHCAFCHGERADGVGIRREGLSRRPTNFRSRDWRENADPLDVYRLVTEGKQGTSMPAWPTLDDDERWAVVSYILSVAGERVR